MESKNDGVSGIIKHDKFIIKVFTAIIMLIVITIGAHKIHRDYQIAKVLIHRGSSLTVEEAFSKSLTEIFQSAAENMNNDQER